MMKNINIKIILVALSLIILPFKAHAMTIAEFEAEVNKYSAQLQAKQNQVARNDEEIRQIKLKIADYQAQIDQAKIDVQKLELEIEKNEKEIAKKKEESKKLMEYYQVSNGTNAYLEYAFGATSITDMIYRMSVVEQLTDYNNQLMKELTELIEKNEKQKVELTKKQETLKQLQKSLADEKAKIEDETKIIKESMPSVQQQINAAKANVRYYKSLGCGKTEDVGACQYRIEQARRRSSTANGTSGVSVPSTNGFYRPMEYGYVTQGYGGYGGHLGVDLSSSDKSIPIYPIADGVVFYKGYDCYGALVVKIKHNYGGRYIYSTYAHMRSFGAISTGQYISHNTSLGRMGSTGWSTGPHLHLEITTCDWNAGGGCASYKHYTRSTINPFNLISIPSRWSNR